jgi:DNA-binding transcriptional regulator YhcF (GntR family)
MEELELEEIQVNQNENNVLKIYVYNTKGEKVKEEFYSLFIEVYDYVLEHNSEFPDDPYNIYPGTIFPPKGYKWNKEIGDWVELNLFEKWQKGELEIPNDCKVVNNIIVRKNLQELLEEGIIEISNTKKIDVDLNLIVDKSEQELIDEGLLDWELIYDRLYNDFKIKLDNYLDMYYFKYPKNILSHFKEKAEIAKRWVNMSVNDKKIERSFEFINFQLIISEFKSKNIFLTLDQVEDQLDELCQKIINKNTEIETKIGSIHNFFNKLYEEMKALKEKKNYLELLTYIHSVDNKIIKWIKS